MGLLSNSFAAAIRKTCLSILALSILTVSAGAQNQQSQRRPTHVHARSVGGAASAVIDGATHPELISDQEAITVLWISIMEPPTAGEVEKARFSAKIGRMNLDDNEKALVWAAARAFHAQFTPYLAQAQQLAADASNPATPAGSLPDITQKRVAVAAAIDHLAMTTHGKLLSSLSAKGAESLTASIADVKAHIKIVPPPKM